MQRYLNQLVADMELAIRNAPEGSTYRFIPHFRDDEEEDDIRVMQARMVRLCDLFNLSPHAFPPVERLTKAQVTTLLTTIENLWRAWRIFFDCPAQLSARRRYTIMTERMVGEPVRFHYEEGAHLNFCDTRAAGKCPLGDQDVCWCAELEEIERFEAEWRAKRRGELGVIDSDSEDFYAPLELEDDFKKSPIEELESWLRGTPEIFNPWEEEEIDERERWNEFIAEEDMMTWLYFYRPRPDDFEEEPEISSEDFEDFAWNADDGYDLPF